MQHKPRFNGILVVAVLMVLVLFFVSLSPLLASSASGHINYSEVYYYFENQQVTSYRLDLGTYKLEMWLKEGNVPLPEATVQIDDQESGGLLSTLGGSEEDMLPPNGGTVYVSYKLPYGIDFSSGKI
ncbi:ATP-dependent zinc metalloprotease FtsH, partial [bacterium]|nr:ATP-dependent zinc metalloprotease FtsH [bacterium]